MRGLRGGGGVTGEGRGEFIVKSAKTAKTAVWGEAPYF